MRPGGALAAGALLGLLAGCATKPAAKPENYLFFPPAPDEPRIQFLTSFGSEADLAGKGGFKEFVVGREQIHRPIWKPYGVATTKGNLFVCDTQAKNVGCVDLAKNRLRYLKPVGPGAMFMPVGVAVDAEGTRYVTDTDIKRDVHRVLMFDASGSYKGVLDDAKNHRPCGIAIAGNRIYVTDLAHGCVRVYDQASRKPLLTVPRDPNDEKAKLFQPTNVAVDPRGRIHVSDTSGFTVKIYDAEGNHLRTIGDLGLRPGLFALPKGIGVDREGRIYVVDAATSVVQLFDDQGRLLMYFGEPQSSGPGALYLPAGLAVDYENVGHFAKYAAPGYRIEYLILVSNQLGPNKVAVYGFLAKQ